MLARNNRDGFAFALQSIEGGKCCVPVVIRDDLCQRLPIARESRNRGTGDRCSTLK
jgi:hypothetical protein